MNTGVAWLPSARAVKWKFGFKKRAQPLALTTNVFFTCTLRKTAVLSQMKVGITSSRYDLSIMMGWAHYVLQRKLQKDAKLYVATL